MKSGILIFSVSLNATLKFSYNFTGGRTHKVTVQHSGQTADRVRVKNKRLVLRNIQKSDIGVYQVTGTEDEENVTRAFSLVIQNESLVTSPCLTTSLTATSATKQNGEQTQAILC